MYTNPNEVLVKRSDLLPIEEEDGYFLAGGLIVNDGDDPESLAQTALQFLTAAEHLRTRLAREAEQKAAEWELKHAVPAAREMYTAFHNYSDNYKEDMGEDLWLRNYNDRNPLVLKWVSAATAVLKYREEEANG